MVIVTSDGKLTDKLVFSLLACETMITALDKVGGQSASVMFTCPDEKTDTAADPSVKLNMSLELDRVGRLSLIWCMLTDTGIERELPAITSASDKFAIITL